jgi:hypothetical protein
MRFLGIALCHCRRPTGRNCAITKAFSYASHSTHHNRIPIRFTLQTFIDN